MSLGVHRAPLHAPADSAVAAATASTATGRAASRTRPGTRRTTGSTPRFERTRPPTRARPRSRRRRPPRRPPGCRCPARSRSPSTSRSTRAPSTPARSCSRTTPGAAVVGLGHLRRATRTATLTPLSPLALGKEYTATVLSGTAGVTDLAGNRLAADKVWTLPHAGGVPVHGLQAAPTRPPGVGRARPAGRGRDEVPLGRGRLHHLAALLQAGEQHRHARRPPLVRHRRSCSRPRRSRTRPHPGWQTVDAAQPRAGGRRTPPTSPPTTRRSGYFAFDQGYFTHGVDNARR